MAKPSIKKSLGIGKLNVKYELRPSDLRPPGPIYSHPDIPIIRLHWVPDTRERASGAFLVRPEWTVGPASGEMKDSHLPYVIIFDSDISPAGTLKYGKDDGNSFKVQDGTGKHEGKTTYWDFKVYLYKGVEGSQEFQVHKVKFRAWEPGEEAPEDWKDVEPYQPSTPNNKAPGLTRASPEIYDETREE